MLDQKKSKEFENFDKSYRECVGLVIFNKKGKVFAGRRFIKQIRNYEKNYNLWQFPQGGIDEGESALEAAYREIYEETGIKSLRLLGKINEWLYYDLPQELLGVALNGKFKGQKQKWFAFLFTGDEAEIQINPPPDNHPVEFDQWAFVDFQKIVEEVIPFKKPVYERLIKEFSHFYQ